MLYQNNKNKINELLNQKLKVIDISLEAYAKAINYKIELEECYGSEYEIYPQGSVRLGTVTNNGYEKENYDIDLVLKYLGTETSPRNLRKNCKPNVIFKVSEKKPCWNIEINNILNIDITPSIADISKSQGIKYSELAEKITRGKGKKTEEGFESYYFKDSNPKGYYKWFKSINKKDYDSSYKLQEEELQFKVSQENFSEIRKYYSSDISKLYKPLVRTELQKAIQILKFFRDKCFCNNENKEYKPISIVITTLVAVIYKDIQLLNTLKEYNFSLENIYSEEYLNKYSSEYQISMYDIIMKFIELMLDVMSDKVQVNLSSVQTEKTKFINPLKSFIKTNGKWYLPNPTDKDENFIDRWNESDGGEQRVKAFIYWLEYIKNIMKNDEYLEEYLFPKKNINYMPENKPYTY